MNIKIFAYTKNAYALGVFFVTPTCTDTDTPDKVSRLLLHICLHSTDHTINGKRWDSVNKHTNYLTN